MPWQPLLDWWFGQERTAAGVAAQKYRLWFGYSPSQDREAAARFGAEAGQALAGGLGHWCDEPEGWLALILLLDQLPRMIHRGTPAAFAGDARALALTRQGLARRWERALVPIRQVFVYMPLEHAEDLACQELAVGRFGRLYRQAQAGERELFADFLDYAERHCQVIRRFGRFPHRNAILGRSSTVEESAFLAQPGASF